MTERTALEIADGLGRIWGANWCDEAVAMLRKQHAEIEHLREMLTGNHEEPWAENRRLRRYVGNNMLMSDFRNVDEMRAEIKRLTACLFTMQNAAMALTAERDTSIAAADALRAALLDIHALRPIGLSASVYALTVENIARSAIAKAAEEKA